MMSSFSLPSFAKINLGLRVIGRRPDGFHDIFTVYQTVSLFDTVHFSPAPKISLTCDDASLNAGDQNLIVRAANAFRERFAVSHGAAIHLEKRIPHPGGLGGGSSNAATTLIGLARLWNINAPSGSLDAIAQSLGSDVPFFLTGGTALGLGRGTEILSSDDFVARFILIVTPAVEIATADAFKALNARNLTSSDANRILQICRLEAQNGEFDLSGLYNDFETTVFAAYPEIADVHSELLRLGARRASLSGSGASVFGIFDNEETRQTAMKALDERVNWRKFAVATISRFEYREALKIVY